MVAISFALREHNEILNLNWWLLTQRWRACKWRTTNINFCSLFWTCRYILKSIGPFCTVQLTWAWAILTIPLLVLTWGKYSTAYFSGKEMRDKWPASYSSLVRFCQHLRIVRHTSINENDHIQRTFLLIKFTFRRICFNTRRQQKR